MVKNHRSQAIEKLNNTLNYPGRFPVLVIGDTGTGKTHWIVDAINKADEFSGKYKLINAGLCEDNLEFWKNTLKESDNQFLIIKDVEKLSKISQEILFDGISTKNGLYGFDEKNLTIRIVFISTLQIQKIRDDRRYLTARFFDRISQFVVEFPNFETTQRSIYDDFKSTWDKMFKVGDKYIAECPGSPELMKWLEEIAYKMHGNFRDLDKIVINWHLQQISMKSKIGSKEEIENQILGSIKSDFDKYLHNPSQKISDDNIFVFDEDLDYSSQINNFRDKIKKWSMAINDNSIRKAAQMLKISYRTMERW